MTMPPEQTQPSTDPLASTVPTPGPDPQQQVAGVQNEPVQPTPAPFDSVAAQPTELAMPQAQTVAQPTAVQSDPLPPMAAAPVAAAQPLAPSNAAPTYSPDPIAAPSGMAQPPLDSSQPGYVPPANPQPVAPMGANMSGGKKGGLAGKLRIIIAVVVGLAVLSGAGLLLKDTLFSGSNISTSDLVEETVDGLTFKHPKQWDKIEDGDYAAAYTEGGKPLDESDQAMAVIIESLPIDVDSLDQATKDRFYDEIEKQFSDPDSLEGDGCKKVEDVKVSDAKQSNYTTSVAVEYTCTEFTGRNLVGKFKAVVGIKGRDMHVVAIGAIDKTWDKSGEALNEILNTFKPAE